MDGDDFLNPRLDDTRRFGQETSSLTGAHIFGGYDEYGSHTTNSFIGQDYDRWSASVVFTATPEVVFTNDGLTPIPFIPIESQSRQLHKGDPLLGISEPVLSPDSTDLLLGFSTPKADVTKSIVDGRQIYQSEAVVPIVLLPQLIEDVAKKVLAIIQPQPTTAYHFNQPQFGGGFAETVHGSQVGGVVANNQLLASQSILFEWVEQYISDLISGPTIEYSVDTDFSAASLIDVARQVVDEIEQRPDLKQKIVEALPNFEIDGFRKQSANPVINIVLAAFLVGDSN